MAGEAQHPENPPISPDGQPLARAAQPPVEGLHRVRDAASRRAASFMAKPIPEVLET
jgi:hypothetical protein